MASRFIDTEIWKEDWFCDLGNEYQSFWVYITCHCDNAGIWKPNKIDFEIKSRIKINMASFLEKINEGGCKDRIIVTDSGRWFLTGFIAFQWFNKTKSFNLVLTNKLHKHIYNLLKNEGIQFKKIRGLGEVLGEVFKTSMVMDNISNNNSSNRITNKKESNGGLVEVLERSKKFLIPEMLSVFKSFNPDYPADEDKDHPALGEIVRFIEKQENIPKGRAIEKEATAKVLTAWRIISEFIANESFFRNYNLSQVAKYIQSIVQKLKNGKQGNSKGGQSKTITRSALEKLKQMPD